MDFKLNEREKMLKSAAREFAQKAVLPLAMEIDRSAQFPLELARQLGQLGYYSLAFPPEHGGSGAGYLGLTLAVEQISQASLAAGVAVAMSACVGDELVHYGTEEQRQKYLLPLVKGDVFACWAFTEPSTGSDPKALASTAKPDGDDYVISGEKVFISLAPIASWGAFFAKDETGRVSAFIIETSTPGLVIGALHDLMGARGLGTSTIYLNDVRVPKQNMLGPQGKGYDILLEGASMERLAVATGSLGVGQAALDLSIDYAKQRLAYGRPIAELPTIHWLLAEMACRLEPSRWLTYQTAFLHDQGENIQAPSSVAKLFCSQMVVDITRMAMQIHGAYGTEKTMPMERLYRDAKMLEIIVGVSEIQRVIIAHSLLRRR